MIRLLVIPAALAIWGLVIVGYCAVEWLLGVEYEDWESWR